MPPSKDQLNIALSLNSAEFVTLIESLLQISFFEIKNEAFGVDIACNCVLKVSLHPKFEVATSTKSPKKGLSILIDLRE